MATKCKIDDKRMVEEYLEFYLRVQNGQVQNIGTNVSSNFIVRHTRHIGYKTLRPIQMQVDCCCVFAKQFTEVHIPIHHEEVFRLIRDAHQAEYVGTNVERLRSIAVSKAAILTASRITICEG